MYISNIKELKRVLKINKNITDSDGRNLYFYLKNKDMFNLCLENKVAIKNDYCDNTPLFFCEDPEVFTLFINNGVNPKHKNMNGQNALFFTNAKCSEILLKYGVDVNDLDKDRNNALIYAEKVSLKLGEYLKKKDFLIKNGLDIKHTNIKGLGYINQVNYFTPELIDFLLKNKVSFDTTRRFSGKHLFESSGYLIEKLPEEELLKIDFSQISQNNYNPLLLNVINNFKTLKKIKTIQDINVTNSNNENILFYIDKLSLLKRIINNTDINLNIVNNKNENVLFSSNMTKEKIKILLDKGVDYTHNNKDNLTPLLYHLNKYNEQVKEKDKFSKYKKKYDFHIDCACVLLDHQLRIEHNIPIHYSVREDLLEEKIVNKEKIIINDILLDKYILLGKLAPDIRKPKNRL